MFELDHMSDDDIDYTQHDQECSERWTWLADAFPWMTLKEVEEQTKRPEFPGILADFTELQKFVQKVSKNRSRLVACRVTANSFTVGAKFDLVSGRAYLVDNGRYEQMELSGYLTIEFAIKGPHRTISTLMLRGEPTTLCSRDVLGIVERLGDAGLLPSL